MSSGTAKCRSFVDPLLFNDARTSGHDPTTKDPTDPTDCYGAAAETPVSLQQFQAQLDPLNIYHWCADDETIPLPAPCQELAQRSCELFGILGCALSNSQLRVVAAGPNCLLTVTCMVSS